MARMGLPIGPTVLQYTLPSGVTASQAINLVGGYNVVYIRMFRNRATVLTSNDPAAIPSKTPIAVAPATVDPISTQPSSVLPATLAPKPAEGAFAGFMKLLDGFKDPKPEETAPGVTSPVSAVETLPASATVQETPAVSIPVSNPNSAPSTSPSPASVNIEDGAKPYEPPNLLNSLQQLFN
jgi:hypothetical protein